MLQAAGQVIEGLPQLRFLTRVAAGAHEHSEEERHNQVVSQQVLAQCVRGTE